MSVLKFCKEHSLAKTPTRTTSNSVGFDLYSVEYCIVEPRSRALVNIGIKLELPPETYGRISPRSGLSLNYGIDIGAGVIDQDYRGVIKVLVFNHSGDQFIINPGDRIAQLICERICCPILEESSSLDFTLRGSSGFGSSGISVASSIFTITTMAIDRYLAIIRPFGLRYRCFNRTSTIIMIFVLWSFSLILFSPNLWIADLQFVMPNSTIHLTMCRMNYANFPVPQHVIGIVWFIFMFAIPGCIMTIAYAMMGKTLCSALPPFDNNESACAQQRNRVMRSRKRVACILLLLAFVFACCWLPYHTLNLIMDTTEQSKEESNYIQQVNAYLLLLGHANSALNPIIYCALSRNFRNSIKSLLKFKITCRRKKNNLNNWAADSSGSGFQAPPNKKALPLMHHNHNDFGLSRRQSSQKTTKTCAV